MRVALAVTVLAVVIMASSIIVHEDQSMTGQTESNMDISTLEPYERALPELVGDFGLPLFERKTACACGSKVCTFENKVVTCYACGLKRYGAEALADMGYSQGMVDAQFRHDLRLAELMLRNYARDKALYKGDLEFYSYLKGHKETEDWVWPE